MCFMAGSANSLNFVLLGTHGSDCKSDLTLRHTHTHPHGSEQDLGKRAEGGNEWDLHS